MSVSSDSELFRDLFWDNFLPRPAVCCLEVSENHSFNTFLVASTCAFKFMRHFFHRILIKFYESEILLNFWTLEMINTFIVHDSMMINDKWKWKGFLYHFYYHLYFWAFLHSQYENSHDIEVSMNKTDGRKQWSVRNESLTDGFWIMVAYELCMSAGSRPGVCYFTISC